MRSEPPCRVLLLFSEVQMGMEVCPPPKVTLGMLPWHCESVYYVSISTLNYQLLRATPNL